MLKTTDKNDLECLSAFNPKIHIFRSASLHHSVKENCNTSIPISTGAKKYA